MAAALRQLGISSLKRIYRLDVPELCTALQDASRRRVQDKKVWDALLYRAALLRSELRPNDLARTVDAMARARRRDEALMDYLLQEVRTKARKFLVRDAALLLNGFAKAAVRDEILTASLMPSLLRRLSEKTRWDDMALLSLSFTRLGDQHRDAIFDRVVAVSMPRIELLNNAHTLSLLTCAFVRQPSTKASGVLEPLFAEGEAWPQLADGAENALSDTDPGSDLEGAADGREGQIAHLPFVEVLLTQCERHLWSFRSADILHLCLALSTLARAGHESVFPSRLLKRLETRMQALYFEFLPAQFVRLLEVLAHLPDLEQKCAKKLLDEVAYRMRDVTPRSCISVLQTIRRLGGHERAHSAVSWRLVRDDAKASLTAAEVCQAAEIFAELEPKLWESREAMLCLLQGITKRRLEPSVDILAKMLRAYGTMGVRDTHWFHIARKLCVCDLGGATPRLPRQAVPETLDETVVSDSLLALARLNLPQLVDAAALFTRAAVSVKSPAAAAACLEAAGLFALLGRRPEELTSKALAPVLQTALGDKAAEVPAQLRFFPFTHLAAAAVDSKGTLAALQRAAAATHAAPVQQDPFGLAIGHAISSWTGVGLVANVAVGPVCVPWAVNLVDLAQHLQANPLDGAGLAQPLSARADLDDLAAIEEGASAGRRRGRRWGRSGGRRAPAAARNAEQGEEADEGEDSDSDWGPAAPGAASPRTHVLILPLREADFFHASASLRGERQRMKTQLLGAERYAEITLLKNLGWRVCGISEHLWTWGPDGDRETALANKELIFKMVAGIGDDS